VALFYLLISDVEIYAHIAMFFHQKVTERFVTVHKLHADEAGKTCLAVVLFF
jgi:hypothetical protein